jgi:hypothetical protein
MFRKPLWDPAGRKRRARELRELVRAWPHEVADVSIAGRSRIIFLLSQAEVLQRETRNRLPQHYKPDMHKRVLAALESEREALAAMTRGLPADHPQLQLRLVK